MVVLAIAGMISGKTTCDVTAFCERKGRKGSDWIKIYQYHRSIGKNYLKQAYSFRHKRISLCKKYVYDSNPALSNQ